MMYRLKKSITEGSSEEINPEIDAEDVNNRKVFFRNNYYNEFIEPKPFFNDLKLYQRLSGDPIPIILNDAHSWAGRYPNKLWSFPVSECLKTILEKHTLAGCKFYPGNLNFQGKEYPYYIFHILDNAWAKVVDLNKSVFTEWENGGFDVINLLDYIILSLEEFKLENSKLRKQSKEKYDIMYVLAPKELHFSEQIDLVYLPKLRWVISERLKQSLEKANISGLEYDPITNVDFYYQGEKI